MLPSQRNKVDISKLTEEEQKLFRLYGKLPTHKNVITKMQKDRKYFDSGDYALSKAGKAPQTAVGTAIPSPENIPHATPSPSINTAVQGSINPGSSPTNVVNSPVKESHLSQSSITEVQEAEPTVSASATAAPVNIPKSTEDA